jgi:hypothetical protein
MANDQITDIELMIQMVDSGIRRQWLFYQRTAHDTKCLHLYILSAFVSV